jgi:guanylate kinase
VLINDDVGSCYGEVQAILRAERLKRRRQIGLIGFARDLIRSVPDGDTSL